MQFFKQRRSLSSAKKNVVPINKRRSSRYSTKDNVLFLALISVAVFIILANIAMHYHMNGTSDTSLSHKSIFFNKALKRDSSTSSLKAGGGRSSSSVSLQQQQQKENQANSNPNTVEEENNVLGTLTCKNYNNGLTKESIEEMIYWKDIASDKAAHNFASPFYDHDKYLLFQPDHGGWNNIRMAMETIIVLAIGTGRTLVLPPEAKMYLLTNWFSKQKKEFGFNDFFDLEALANDHSFINIITMKEFLTNHLPKLINPKTKQPYPKIGKTNWDGVNDLHPLWNYMSDNAFVDESWQPAQCIAVIPTSTEESHTQMLDVELRKIFTGQKRTSEKYINNPVPVNASLFQRIAEQEAERIYPCIFTAQTENPNILYFPVNPKLKMRMLTHFYSFVTFENWKQDVWMKRLIRDYIRYKDEFFCVAARIVQEIRTKAREHDPTNVEGTFDAFHVRRGDFQYKKIKLSAEELYESSKGELKEGGTLYIATDEKDKSFFKLFEEKFNVLFLDDFVNPYLHGMNTNFYGMMDQLISSRSRVFFGSYRSTFSGYINRMRGYYSTRYKLPGYKEGIIDSWYFTPEEYKEEMRKYMAVRLPLYMREFPVAWRDIDLGIGEAL